MTELKFSPYVCPECQSMVMNFEIENGKEICGLCETPLIEYKAIPSEELSTLRDDKLKLEIAARDFLRACEMRGQILPSEFSAARDTLAAMVNKGEE